MQRLLGFGSGAALLHSFVRFRKHEQALCSLMSEERWSVFFIGCNCLLRGIGTLHRTNWALTAHNHSARRQRAYYMLADCIHAT